MYVEFVLVGVLETVSERSFLEPLLKRCLECHHHMHVSGGLRCFLQTVAGSSAVDEIRDAFMTRYMRPDTRLSGWLECESWSFFLTYTSWRACVLE